MYNAGRNRKFSLRLLLEDCHENIFLINLPVIRREIINQKGFTPKFCFAIIKPSINSIFGKGGDRYMTGKEIVNLIRQLRKDGMSDTKILDLIEFIETHDPKEQNDDK